MTSCIDPLNSLPIRCAELSSQFLDSFNRALQRQLRVAARAADPYLSKRRLMDSRPLADHKEAIVRFETKRVGLRQRLLRSSSYKKRSSQIMDSIRVKYEDGGVQAFEETQEAQRGRDW